MCVSVESCGGRGRRGTFRSLHDPTTNKRVADSEPPAFISRSSKDGGEKREEYFTRKTRDVVNNPRTGNALREWEKRPALSKKWGLKDGVRTRRAHASVSSFHLGMKEKVISRGLFPFRGGKDVRHLGAGGAARTEKNNGL